MASIMDDARVFRDLMLKCGGLDGERAVDRMNSIDWADDLHTRVGWAWPPRATEIAIGNYVERCRDVGKDERMHAVLARVAYRHGMRQWRGVLDDLRFLFPAQSVFLHVPPQLLRQEDMAIELPSQTVRHVKALRLAPNDNVTLFDGSGHYCVATIEKGLVASRRSPLLFSPPMHDIKVSIVSAIPDNQHDDAMVANLALLGAERFAPLVCKRSSGRRDPDRLKEKKLARWQRIVLAECEVGKRLRGLIVEEPMNFEQLLESQQASGATFFGDIDGMGVAETSRSFPITSSPMVESFPDTGLSFHRHELRCVIGPEGGFDSDESRSMAVLGWRPLSLSDGVLRTENAAAAATTLLRMAEWVF